MKATTFFLKESEFKQRAEDEVLVVLFLLFVVYFVSLKMGLNPSTDYPAPLESGIVTTAPSVINSRKDIIDIIWSCQPQSVLNKQENNCTSSKFFTVINKN